MESRTHPKLKQTSKAEKMQKVAEGTMKVLSTQGHSGITFSNVAKASGVSRPWLYKYFGCSDQALLDFMTETFATSWGKTEMVSNARTPRRWVRETMDGYSAFLDAAVESPWVMTLYFRHRGTQTSLGLKIKSLEDHYIQAQADSVQAATGFPAAQAKLVSEVLLGVRLGLAHRWVFGGIRKTTSKNNFLRFLTYTLQSLIRQ